MTTPECKPSEEMMEDAVNAFNNVHDMGVSFEVYCEAVITAVRAEIEAAERQRVLEEAAKVADEWDTSGPGEAGAQIRALKAQP